MLPNQFIDDFRKLKDQRPDHDVCVRVREIGEYGHFSETIQKVTNVVIGPEGVEIICEPV